MTLSESARPYSADNGPMGVLLSHGFTGSPASLRPWAVHLAGLGYTVRLPRLPGHGTTWQEMNRTRWEDWYAEVDRALDELVARCDRVAVAGLSMGGGLVLRLAEQRPQDVAAVVLVNPSVRSSDPRMLAVPVVRHLVASISGIGSDIKKPGVQESGYDRTPLHALHSMTRLWRDVEANLARVRAPLLLFRSAEDHVVDPSSAAAILRKVSSPVARETMLYDSYHVATLDNDAEQILTESAAFIAEHVGAGAVDDR